MNYFKHVTLVLVTELISGLSWKKHTKQNKTKYAFARSLPHTLPHQVIGPQCIVRFANFSRMSEVVCLDCKAYVFNLIDREIRICYGKSFLRSKNAIVRINLIWNRYKITYCVWRLSRDLYKMKVIMRSQCKRSLKFAYCEDCMVVCSCISLCSTIVFLTRYTVCGIEWCFVHESPEEVP